jgi:3-methyladenine DNA glycosylase AlkD
VKKAICGALHQIGTRNLILNCRAVVSAERISKIDSKNARWVASDTLQESKSGRVIERLEQKCVTSG